MHLGNYFNAPQILDIGTDSITHRLYATWLYAPIRNPGMMESDVFMIPVKPDSLVASVEQVAGGGTVTFMLNAGIVNANRPFVLLASVYGTDPGYDLLAGMTPTCPENLPAPLRESVFPLNLNLPFVGVGSGFLDSQGFASVPYLVPAHGSTTDYDIAYALGAPHPTGLGGVDFVSNPVQIQVTPGP